MQSPVKLSLIVVLLAGHLFGAAYAEPHQDRAAEQFVQEIASEGIAIIDNTEWTVNQKRERFRDLMGKHIAFRFFGRSALGPFARVPSEEQFKRYVELLQDYAAYSMQSQLNEYVGQAVRVLSSRVKDSGRLAYVSVSSEVYDRASGNIEGTARWVLIRRLNEKTRSESSTGAMKKAEATVAEGGNAQYKVYDLVLQTAGESASFSLLQTQRDEFTAILTKNRRNFEALLDHIREQIRKIRESN